MTHVRYTATAPEIEKFFLVGEGYCQNFNGEWMSYVQSYDVLDADECRASCAAVAGCWGYYISTARCILYVAGDPGLAGFEFVQSDAEEGPVVTSFGSGDGTGTTQCYSYYPLHNPDECTIVTFTTLDRKYSDSSSTSRIDGYGTVPKSCKDDLGSYCTIQLCAPALKITATGTNAWYFRVTVGGLDITDNGVAFTSADYHIWGQMDTDKYDIYEEWALLGNAYSACSLSCIRGTSGECNQFEGAWSGGKAVCEARTCAPYAFVTGVIAGESDPCIDGVAIKEGQSCTIKCTAEYVTQTATVTCAPGALQDESTTGGITSCVGRC